MLLPTHAEVGQQVTPGLRWGQPDLGFRPIHKEVGQQVKEVGKTQGKLHKARGGASFSLFPVLHVQK